MKIKTSSTTEATIQDNVFLKTAGVITNGRAYNTIAYYRITAYNLGQIIKEIQRCK